MIERDQPTHFQVDILVRVSSKSDGTVLDKAAGVHHPTVVANRIAFCDLCAVDYDDVVYQRILYDKVQAYDKIVRVDARHVCRYAEEVHADALITQTSGVGLLLLVADCVATVLYDSATKQLALVHLGRHSTIANLMQKTLREMIVGGANARDIVVWMAPSVKAAHYVMEYFDYIDDPAWRPYARREADGIHIDLQGYNRAIAIEIGVDPENIDVSPVDTAASDDYFSHSNGDTSGRFAVLAMIRS